jgi:hypothetical protein
MKFLKPLLLTVILTGCSTEPSIVPDTTADNVVMMQLKDQISQPGGVKPTYGWLFWYGPVAILGIMWGYRNLIKKPINCLEEEPDTTSVSKTVTPVSIETEQPK